MSDYLLSHRREAHYWRSVFIDLLIRNLTFALFAIGVIFFVTIWWPAR